MKYHIATLRLTKFMSTLGQKFKEQGEETRVSRPEFMIKTCNAKEIVCVKIWNQHLRIDLTP
jgi:hypothetical protein